MPKRTSTIVRAAIGVGLLACGSASRGAEPEVHEIGVDKLAFGPAPTGLRLGDVVEWTNSDILRHTATATDGSFDVDLPPGAKGRGILKRAGVLTYICRFHPGMKGQLVVSP